MFCGCCDCGSCFTISACCAQLLLLLGKCQSVSLDPQGILVSNDECYHDWKGRNPPKPIKDAYLPTATLLLEISHSSSPCANAGQELVTRLWVGGTVVPDFEFILNLYLYCFAGSRCADSYRECVQRGINAKVCVAGTQVTPYMRPAQQQQQQHPQQLLRLQWPQPQWQWQW